MMRCVLSRGVLFFFLLSIGSPAPGTLPVRPGGALRTESGGSPSVQAGLEERLREPPDVRPEPAGPLRQAQDDRPGRRANGTGLEEGAIWPVERPLTLQTLEPVLILRAEGGFGDIAFLMKVLDILNARGVTPAVAVVGPQEKQAEALRKLEQLKQDIPAQYRVQYRLWREQGGRLVDEAGQPVAGGRSLRPVLIQHFSQVNPDWARETAEDFVPRLIEPLYPAHRGKILLIGYNAPGNVFGAYLLPGQGEFLNLYLTAPTAAGPHEPNAIYTGELLDRPLRALTGQLRALSPEQRRGTALENLSARVPLPAEVIEAAMKGELWATLYTSQGGNRRQLKFLLDAFDQAHRSATLFTFYGRNPQLWYYPKDYWQPHEEQVALLKSDGRVSFLDFSRDPESGRPIFGSAPREGAPIRVINLPPIPMGAMRWLMGASDLVLAPGHNTLMEAIGMAAEGVGPWIVLPFQLFEAERQNLFREMASLEQPGNPVVALDVMTSFDFLRNPGWAGTILGETSGRNRLILYLQSDDKPGLLREQTGLLASRAMERSRRKANGNMGNRLTELLEELDRDATLGELLGASPASAAQEVKAFQREQSELVRRGREGQRPISAGLEEISVGSLSAVAGSEAVQAIEVSVTAPDGRVQGRAVIVDPQGAVVRQLVNPDVMDSRWDSRQIRTRPIELQPGQPLASLVSDPHQWGTVQRPVGSRLVFMTNSLQTNFWEPQGFMVTRGRTVSIPGVAWSKEPTVFVLEGGRVGLRELPLKGGIPDPGDDIQEAVTGPVLVRDGQDVSGSIQQYPPEAPDPAQVNWDSKTVRAALSALGRTGEGRLIFLALAGEPEKGIPQASVGDMARAMIALGAQEAILLGGSMDVQQWLAGDGIQPAILARHNNPPHTSGRPLNAAFAVYLPPASLQGGPSSVLGAGLEERSPLTASRLIQGWSGFSPKDRKRLGDELRRAVSKQRLQQLVENARHPVVPPYTLYELLGQILGRPMPEVQSLVEALPDTVWQPPDSVRVGESDTLAEIPDAVVKELLENTLIMVAAGGAGSRFKNDLPAPVREQLLRLGRLEKVTVAVGASGTSPTLQTLEEISALAEKVGATGVHVLLLVGQDSRPAIERDLEENGQWVDRKRVSIRIVEADTYPSFDPATGQILTTVDPSTGRVRLLRNPNGTYGGFLTVYRWAQRRGLTEGKPWLILNGDETRLHTPELLSRVLVHDKELDVAMVTVPKLTRAEPPGGTRVDLALPGGPTVPLIIEGVERTPNAEKQIAGLPAFNRVEDQAVSAGEDPFGFNTGVLRISARAAAAAVANTPLLRYADRDRDDLPDGKRRNLETFVTHVLTVVGSQPGMRSGDLQADFLQYQAVKNPEKLGRATIERNRHSRIRLAHLPGGDATEVKEEVQLDVRPGFAGFRGEGRLNLSGNVGFVLSRGGLYRVPIVQTVPIVLKDPNPERPGETIQRTVEHPIFADPAGAELLLPANADGTITLAGDRSFSAGLEENPLERYLRQPEVSGGPAYRWRWLTGPGRTLDSLVQDYFPENLIPDLKGGLHPLLERIEQESRAAGNGWTWVDGAGGIGAGLREALALYPSLRPVLNDGVRWTEGDLPPEALQKLRQEAPGRGVQDLWSVAKVNFIQGDLPKLVFVSPEGAPIRLITVFAALSLFPDPLGTLVHLYNQLPPGGILLGNLTVPTGHPKAEGIVKFYQEAFEDLRAHDIGADLKVTDARSTAAPVTGHEPGFQEYQLGFVLRKSPEVLRLQLTPRAEPFLGKTTRPIQYQVVWYEGDRTRPFAFSSAGLEEGLDSGVRDALLKFQAEPDSKRRLSLVEDGLRGFQPLQRTQFLNALPWLPDRERVSHLLRTAFTENSGLARQVKNQLLTAARENVQDHREYDLFSTVRLLLTRMSWEASNDVLAAVIKAVTADNAYRPGWEEAAPILIIAGSVGAGESTIQDFRTRARPTDAELYSKMAAAHRIIANSYGKLDETASQRVEEAFVSLHAYVAQMLPGSTPDAEVRQQIEQGLPSASYVYVRDALSRHTRAPATPVVRVIELGRLAELEQTYGDFLKVRGDPEAQAHYGEAIELRKRQADLILERQHALGLAPAAGLEEDFVLEGAAAVAKRQISFQGRALQLPNGAWVDARGDGTVEIAPGVEIEPDVLLRASPGEILRIAGPATVKAGARVVGQVEVYPDAEVWGAVEGNPQYPTILGKGTLIQSPNAHLRPGAILLPVQDEGGKLHPVIVRGATLGIWPHGSRIVIWGGTDLADGAVVRENSVLGPFVHVGPGSETKSTFWMGASSNDNKSELAHRNFAGNLIGLPVYLEGLPLEDAWHDQLMDRLTALRFGRLTKREVRPVTQAGPHIHPYEILEMEFDGKRVAVHVRGINFGAEAGSSNFKSVSDGRKAIGVISAGSSFGVRSVVQTPAYVGPDALVDNFAQVKGLQASGAGTYVRPIASATPGDAIRAGAVTDLHSKSGGMKELRLFLGTLRVLQTLARVSVAGLKHTMDPAVRSALLTEIAAYHRHFKEIDAFTEKEFGLLPGGESPAQDIEALRKQAEAMRTAWTEITAAAGLEEAGGISLEEFVAQPEVQEALGAAGGRLWLDAAQAAAVSGNPNAVGALLVRGRPAADLSRPGLFILDGDLENPELERAPWATVIKPEDPTSAGVFSALAGLSARRGDLVILQEGDQFASDGAAAVQARLARALPGVAALPRVAVGSHAAVRAIPAGVLGMLRAQDLEQLPSVVYLGVTFTSQSGLEEQHSLIVFSQA